MKQKFCINDTRLFPGFYESILWNSDTEYRINEYMHEDGQNEYVQYEVDYKEYTQSTAKKCSDLLMSCMYQDRDIITSIEYKGLYSPREYNFSTDKIEVEIDFDYYELYRYLRDHEKELADYLKDNYTSCSGYISFINPELKEFLNRYWDKDDDYIQVALEFYMIENIDHESLENEWCDVANEGWYNHLIETKENYND